MSGAALASEAPPPLDVAAIVLDALLAATPEPPPITMDATEVVALGEEMAAARAHILDDLASRGLAHIPLGPHADRLRVLNERETRWGAALTRAKHQLAERVASISRLGRRGGY